MAGYRLTLKRLAKKYGMDVKGATYAKVVQRIIEDNVARASRRMGELSDRRVREGLREAVEDGMVTLPEYAIPLVTTRKASENGRMVSDTLRNALTRKLREAVLEHPNDEESAIRQMTDGVSEVMDTYTRSHSKMVAVTEVRSAVDVAKYMYALRLTQNNFRNIRVMKRWVHNDHLVSEPRANHKAIDGERVAIDQPFSIGMQFPHDPQAPAEEVIGCQCGYVLEVEEMAINEAHKSLSYQLEVYKDEKKYQVGDKKTRPDGTVWVKTGTYSWAKVKDEEKGEWQDLEGQSADEAKDFIRRYGEKGLYRLTKNGLANLLHSEGIEDPKSLSWQEKVDKIRQLAERYASERSKVKTEGQEEVTFEDFKIFHNKDITLGAKSVKMKDGAEISLSFNEDGTLNDKTYDELQQHVEPLVGTHWGSAKSNNITALSVALVNAPEWKPIDNDLKEFKQSLSDAEAQSALIKGLALRKYAQKALKHPDMSRENVPNFYRGMTLPVSQFIEISQGNVDTIELTGCTAFSSFPEIADQYGSSGWTKSFGADKLPVKLIVERDDYLDNSIGMFHPNNGHFAGGNSNMAFELLSGVPSLYIKSIDTGDKKFGSRQYVNINSVYKTLTDDELGDYITYVDFDKWGSGEALKSELEGRPLGDWVSELSREASKTLSDLVLSRYDDLKRPITKNDKFNHRVYDDIETEFKKKISETPAYKVLSPLQSEEFIPSYRKFDEYGKPDKNTLLSKREEITDFFRSFIATETIRNSTRYIYQYINQAHKEMWQDAQSDKSNEKLQRFNLDDVKKDFVKSKIQELGALPSPTQYIEKYGDVVKQSLQKILVDENIPPEELEKGFSADTILRLRSSGKATTLQTAKMLYNLNGMMAHYEDNILLYTKYRSGVRYLSHISDYEIQRVVGTHIPASEFADLRTKKRYDEDVQLVSRLKDGSVDVDRLDGFGDYVSSKLPKNVSIIIRAVAGRGKKSVEVQDE